MQKALDVRVVVDGRIEHPGTRRQYEIDGRIVDVREAEVAIHRGGNEEMRVGWIGGDQGKNICVVQAMVEPWAFEWTERRWQGRRLRQW